MSELPLEIGRAASNGEFEGVKEWIAGGTASAPLSINDVDYTGWTLIHWMAVGQALPEHVEFVRYLISQGVPLDAQSTVTGNTALRLACSSDEAMADMITVLIAAGASVNQRNMINVAAVGGTTPPFVIKQASASTIDIVTTLLRAGASLNFVNDGPAPGNGESLLRDVQNTTYRDCPSNEHVIAIQTLVASVRVAGSWKAYCKLPHKQILRLRSLAARGRTRERLATTRAIRFLVRQGDNGIVWNILSFWRATN